MTDLDLTGIARTRADLAAADDRRRELDVQIAALAAQREGMLQGTPTTAAVRAVDGQLERAAAARVKLDTTRGELTARVDSLAVGLRATLTPEEAVTSLDGATPVAMFPVRIETRFTGPTTLRVRVFPDSIQVDAHDPALTVDEEAAGRWYWEQLWAANGRPAEEQAVSAEAAWTTLVGRFRPGRARYVVERLRPTNLGPDDAITGPAPTFPGVERRAASWSRAPLATVLPEQFCVVGFRRDRPGIHREVFRVWGARVPDTLGVGPSPELGAPETPAGLPVDEGLAWLHDPVKAEKAGMLLEVEHPELARGVDRLLVLGLDWTISPEQGAMAVERLLAAHRDGGRLAFVAQGTPTNNTGEVRSGFSSDPSVAAASVAPHLGAPAADDWSAGTRLAGAFGLDPTVLVGVPGAATREHAWQAALADVLWPATGGFFLSEMLDPIADDPQVEADLRDHVANHLFASGPLPTIRVGAIPYGVLPVVSRNRYEPRQAAPIEAMMARVAGAVRDLVATTIDQVPHLRRAGEPQELDRILIELLQRTPVPWTFRFRPLVGPVQRKAMSVRWDLAAAYQQTWTALLWSRLGATQLTRLSELTADRDHPLAVPLVRKDAVGDDGEPVPSTAYLAEIDALLDQPGGRTALNVRENSVALLEALAACSAVLELDRTALRAVKEWLERERPEEIDRLRAVKRTALRAPETIRVEAAVAANLPLEFVSGRQMASSIVEGFATSRPLGEVVQLEFAERYRDVAALSRTPTDPYFWLGRLRTGLRTLVGAPVEGLEWAFRGYLDLFSTRLDAWYTSLAHRRLAHHRSGTPKGLHVGCWGWVEDLRRDTDAAAESLGYVHVPSLAHATSTALLRNGRLAHRDEAGALFDLQLTSDRVRRARNLLEGVAQGQRLAALLGYRIERRLREAGLRMMVYQLPLRRLAPLRGPEVQPDEPVEVLAARDVVDGVALLDGWRADPDDVIRRLAGQLGLQDLPAADAAALRAVLDDVAATYDAVSDVLVAEAVHQSAQGNLERAGAALAAHDRQSSAPDLEYIETPRRGHTVGHRVALLLQDATLPKGWPRDARGAAEPRLDAWLARLLGPPAGWRFDARIVPEDGPSRDLEPITASALGIGALSLVLGSQRPSTDRPSELEARIALAFAEAGGAGAPGDRLELLTGDEGGDRGGGAGGGPTGLAALRTLASWASSVAKAPPLSAADVMRSGEMSVGSGPGVIDVAELGERAAQAVAQLGEVVAALAAATTPRQAFDALSAAALFDGPDALPQVAVSHPESQTILTEQAAEMAGRLAARHAAARSAAERPPSVEPAERGRDPDAPAAAHHLDVLRAVFGADQPVLPLFQLADPDPVAASLADRERLIGGDGTAVVTWLHRAALVRVPLDPLASLLLHAEASGAQVGEQLLVMQQPRRPGATWIALPFGPDGVPAHGTSALVAHSWGRIDVAKPMAGVLVDAWTETIPAAGDTTAVTFHYDSPGARAPQAVLLAVHPAVEPDRWDFDTLLDTVAEAADLAQIRAISSPELAPLGTFLPALYLPDDYTRDVPSVQLLDLVRAAEAQLSVSDRKLATVLGKG